MAKRCTNPHGGGGRRTLTPSPDVLSFFKIMIGPFRSTLYIPPKAARKLEILVDHIAYLEDSNGKCWKVEVSFVEKSLAFNQGWGQFVLDHNIIAGEFIVFKYNGGKKFSLQIFGLSGCERLYFPVKRNEDILRLNNSALSNDPPPIKGAKRSIQSPTKPMLYEKQLLDVKNALGHEIAGRHKTKRPPVRKDMVGVEAAEMCHGTNAQKRRKLDNVPKEPSTFAIDSGVCNSPGHALDNQNASTEGVKILVNEDGICFLVIGEHAINEPNQTLVAPISVDVSAMTNDTLPFVTNEAVSCDHEMPMAPNLLPALNSSDKCNAAIEDPTTRNLQEGDLGHAPDTPLKEVPSDKKGNAPDTPFKEVPSDENAECPKLTDENPLPCVGHLPECSGSPKPIGKSSDIVVTREVPSDENPLPCVNDLPDFAGKSLDIVLTREVVPSDENPVPCVNLLPECSGSPKPIGKSSDIVVTREVPSDENPLPDVNDPPDFAGKSLDILVTREVVPSDENPVPCANHLPECPGSSKHIGKSLGIVVMREVVPSNENALQCMDNLLECPGSPKPIAVENVDQVLALPEPVRFSFTVAAEIQPYQELPSLLPIKRMRIGRKVVLFRDSSQRVWPIVYHEDHNAKFTGFSSGWSTFTSANDVKGGDCCVLELASELDALFDVQMSQEGKTSVR